MIKGSASPRGRLHDVQREGYFAAIADRAPRECGQSRRRCTLKFENPLKGTVDQGTAFKFKGVIDSFVKDPFMLTFATEKEDVDGLPASLFSTAPSKPRRPAATKKKQ